MSTMKTMAGGNTTAKANQLPLRALVACAVRCARRVQPMFTFSLPDSHPKATTSRAAVEAAVALAETFAGGGQVELQQAQRAEEQAVQALMLTSQPDFGDQAAAYAANAAYAVINATLAALRSLEQDASADLQKQIVSSVDIATDAAMSADRSVYRAVCRDREALLKLQLGTFPELGRPIDPGESGPLGPLFGVQTTPVEKSRSFDNPPSSAAATESLRDELKVANREEPEPQPGPSPNKKPSGKTKKRVGRIRAAQDELTVEQEKLAKQQNVLCEEVEAFQAERDAFLAQRDALLDELEKLKEVRGQSESLSSNHQDKIAELEEELSEQNALLKEKSAQLDAERSVIEKMQAELQEAGNSLPQTTDEIKKEQEQIKEERLELRELHKALQAVTAQLEGDKQKLREAASRIESDKKRFIQSRSQHEAEQQSLQEEFEQLHDTYRCQQEALEVERVEFLEEKARVAIKAAEIHQAAQRLHNNDSEAQNPDEESHDSQAVQQPPDEAVAQLQTLLDKLNEQRQQLKQERRQLSDLFSLVHAGIKKNKSRQSASSDRKKNIPTRKQRRSRYSVKLIVEPRTASSLQVAGLLDELSQLNEVLGGNGLDFEAGRCMLWSVNERGGSEYGEGEERALVEVRAIPRISAGISEPNPADWDRFTSSLMMAVRLDAGLGNCFDLGESATLDHPIYERVTDAVARIEDSYSRQSEQSQPRESQGLSIDSLNQQLQRIEELCRALEQEKGFSIQLSSSDDDWLDEDESIDEVPVDLTGDEVGGRQSESDNRRAAPASARGRSRQMKIALAVAAAVAGGVLFWLL